MKISQDAVLEQLGTRVSEGDHLVAAACEEYQKLRSKKHILRAADIARKVSAQDGRYLMALIHDQVYRMAGGED